MAVDTPEFENDCTPEAGKKVRLLSLGDLDGRTGATKAAKALIEALESDLGGADRLTAGERAIVHRAAIAAAMAEHYEAQWLSGRPIDLAAYCTLTNALGRLLRTVGLERRSRDVTPDLTKYIAQRTNLPAGEAAARTVPPPPA